MTKCFIDLDGVLADLHRATCERFDITLVGVPRPVSWNWIYERTGLAEAELWDSLDTEFWANLPLTPEAGEILELAEARFSQVCLLSNPMNKPQAIVGKIRWIERHFPHLPHLLGSCKHFCASDGAVLIDDHDDNVEAFCEAGGMGILLPRPWNKLHYLNPMEYLRRRLG